LDSGLEKVTLTSGTELGRYEIRSTPITGVLDWTKGLRTNQVI